MNNEQKSNSAFWDDEFADEYIYGEYPAKAAMLCAEELIERGLTGKNVCVLELCAGYSRNSLYFNRQLNTRNISMDFSTNAVRLGMQLEAKSEGSVEFLQRDIIELSTCINEASLDVVFHNFSIQLFRTKIRKQIYEVVSHILKPRGLFIGSFLSTDDPECPTERPEDKSKITKTTIRKKTQRFFTEEQIREDLSGFFLVSSITQNRDPEQIKNLIRNTHFHFVIAEKK